jgi:hypothetical protein
MMIALKIFGWIVGIGLLSCGSVMFILAITFGGGGIFDKYRRDRASEVLFAMSAIAGAVLLGVTVFI